MISESIIDADNESESELSKTSKKGTEIAVAPVNDHQCSLTTENREIQIKTQKKRTKLKAKKKKKNSRKEYNEIIKKRIIFHVSRRSFNAGWANGKIIVIELQVTWATGLMYSKRQQLCFQQLAPEWYNNNNASPEPLTQPTMDRTTEKKQEK